MRRSINGEVAILCNCSPTHVSNVLAGRRRDKSNILSTFQKVKSSKTPLTSEKYEKKSCPERCGCKEKEEVFNIDEMLKDYVSTSPRQALEDSLFITLKNICIDSKITKEQLEDKIKLAKKMEQDAYESFHSPSVPENKEKYINELKYVEEAETQAQMFKRLRKLMGYTRREIAELLGVTKTEVKAFEKGHSDSI